MYLYNNTTCRHNDTMLLLLAQFRRLLSASLLGSRPSSSSRPLVLSSMASSLRRSSLDRSNLLKSPPPLKTPTNTCWSGTWEGGAADARLMNSTAHGACTTNG